MAISTQALALLLAGAVQGAAFALLAFAFRRYTRQILFVGLLVAAGAYVGFALYHGVGGSWLLAEVAGAALYGAVGYRGLRGSLGWLAAGWALHPLWDVPLHFVGPGASFAPASYTLPCLTFDLVVAGVVAAVAVRRSRSAAHPSFGARP